MTRRRRRFGPLLYVTAGSAAVILASMPSWTFAYGQWQAWTFARGLHDPAPAARRQAADALGGLGPVATPWAVRASRDPDPKVRLLACTILLNTDPDHPGAAVDALAAAIKDGVAAVRRAAAEQLAVAFGAISAKAEAGAYARAVDALRAALGDPAKEVRLAAAGALGRAGERALPAVAELERALSVPDLATRVAAADALLRIDKAGSRARVVAALLGVLADPSSMPEAHDAVRLLKGELGDEALAAGLVPLLGHGDMGVRHGSMFLLTLYCPDAVATKPALVDALGSPDGGIRCDAALFLLARDAGSGPRALDVLSGQLSDPADGGYVAPDLVRMIRRASPGSIAAVVAGLIGAVREPGPASRRVNAILALAAIGPPDAGPAVEPLRRAASSGDRAVSLRAIGALATVDPRSAAPFVPALIDRLGPGQDLFDRLAAMETLGELGNAAIAAVPALLEVADEEEIRASSAAMAAISRVDPARGAALKRSIREGD